uniref:hypothetical protein n=1 Tax=Actinomadura roseirufa TaxID=2094049 RepID=UPI001A956310
GHGWLAVGTDGAAPRRPLVVTSADGASWQAADGADAFRPGKGQLVTYGAAAGPSGYVIVGEDGLSAATWFSADLKGWERGKGIGGGGLNALPNSNRWLRSATGGAFGFAAAGGVRDATAPQATSNRPAVWISADGRQWALKQLPLPSGASDGVLTQIASRGGTLVAVGNGRDASGPVALGYLSADGGRTWRTVSLPTPDDAKNIQVLALTATGKGFAATGTTGGRGTLDVVSWTSADGTSWKASVPGGTGLGGAGDQQVTGLAAFRNTLLGVGGTSGQDGGQPILWTRPVE